MVDWLAMITESGVIAWILHVGDSALARMVVNLLRLSLILESVLPCLGLVYIGTRL